MRLTTVEIDVLTFLTEGPASPHEISHGIGCFSAGASVRVRARAGAKTLTPLIMHQIDCG